MAFQGSSNVSPSDIDRHSGHAGSEATSSENEILKRNLACLALSSPEVAARIERTDGSPVVFQSAADGATVGLIPGGRRLASLHQPLAEAQQWAERIDPGETACVLVLGFGVGHHVKSLLTRLNRTGIVLVYEPDVARLRTILSTFDCTPWMDPRYLRWITDVDDEAEFTRCFSDIETQMVAGTKILEHGPSLPGFDAQIRSITGRLTDAVNSARTTMTTTLMRSSGTVRNELLNVDHYALGSGVKELSGLAKGRLGVVVSAGPSLQKNIKLLGKTGVRSRCMIIAAQTTLRPLLDAGIKPHFVTALDYHHISKRFYEGLTQKDVEGITLIGLPQAHPVIADSWPGAIRWCRAIVLEQILGNTGPDLAALESASTVAHLSYHFARYLGCDPVALIGQDLGFTDGLYYARGTAIDDVWSTELNPFNTIAKMEWERIVRHRGMLHRLEDVNGRSILTDRQMLTYLRRFETYFTADVQKGLKVIDASEGGVRKASTEVESLRATLRTHAPKDEPPIASIPMPDTAVKMKQADRVCKRLEDLLKDVRDLNEVSRDTADLLGRLDECLADEDRSREVFKAIEGKRHAVKGLADAFEFVSQINQLGAFKRYLADRKIDIQSSDDPRDMQRLQIQRDLVNVEFLEQAGEDAAEMLEESIALLTSKHAAVQKRSSGPERIENSSVDLGQDSMRPTEKVCAFIPIDPVVGGAGSRRSLRKSIVSQSVLQSTLERVGSSNLLDSIVLLIPDDCDLIDDLDFSRVMIPVSVERCGASAFGAEHEVIVNARMFADRCWRGGIAGMTVFDENLSAEITSVVMTREGIHGAVICGPDWPLVEVLGEGGIDALIERWREHRGRKEFIFTQAPPGLGACLASADLIDRLAPKNRLATFGAMLGYRPERPEHDPIAREGNVPINAQVRRSQLRGIFDSSRCRLRIRRALQPFMQSEMNESMPLSNREIVDQLETLRRGGLPSFTPRHVQIELCTGRLGSGSCSPHRYGTIQREPMTESRFKRIIFDLGDGNDSLVTFGGIGDPLQHPRCMDFVRMALDAGVLGIHLRTELQCSKELVQEIATSGVGVVSVELNADSPQTYLQTMGHDGYATVMANIEELIRCRRSVCGSGAGAFALPWIVPRIQRCFDTYEDIEPFFERWQSVLGTPVIDPQIVIDPLEEDASTTLADASNPARAMVSECFRRMTIQSDGWVPTSELDLNGTRTVGNVGELSIIELWRRVIHERRRALREDGPLAFQLRTYQP
jgi:hypothetical protein